VSNSCSGKGAGDRPDRVLGTVGAQPVWLKDQPTLDQLGRTIWKNVSHWVPIEPATRLDEAGGAKAIAAAVLSMKIGGSIDVTKLIIAPTAPRRRPN
jgi:hypothetical protein